MSRRLHYIDWLRVGAVLLLFPFHTSRVFNAGEPFYVKSAGLMPALNFALGFIDRWHMPLLFLLAGASTYFSLKKRSVGTYASERTLRLLVPLLFGFLLLIPPQTYIGGTLNSGYSQSFAHYITSGDFLRFNIQDGGDYFGGFGIGHLWFVLFLFVMSFIALPFFAWARSERGSARVQRWSRRLAHPAMWLVPPVILFFAEAVPEIGGKNLFYDLVFFVLGFVVIADDAFAESAEKWHAPALAVGTAVTLWWLLVGPLRDRLPDPSWSLTGMNYAGMLGVWLVLVGFIGLGKRWLDRPSPALTYLAEGSYPVYILHQTVIVLVAYYLVRLPVTGPVQWLAVFAAAVTLTFGLYEGIRRVGALRFVFGMRPMPAAAPLAERAPAT